MLRPVVAHQDLGNRLLVALTTMLLQGRQLLGLRSPATMARMMARPVTPVMSVITWVNCTFICCNAFRMC
jgi:hypothetical protein